MAAKKTNDYDLRRAVVAALLAGGVARDAIRHEITLDSASRGGRVDLVIADDAALFGVEISGAKTRAQSHRWWCLMRRKGSATSKIGIIAAFQTPRGYPARGAKAKSWRGHPRA